MNKNVVKIVLSSLILQLTIAISGFILPKYFIETYGSEVNGLINSIKQFLTYFSSVSLGLAAASSAALYEPLYNKDEKKINGILSSTRVFFNKTGLLFFGFVMILAISYPFLIKSQLKSIDIFSIILILGMGSFCEYILVSKYRVLLISDQKNYIVSRITAEGVIINLIVSVFLISNGFNFIVVQGVATVTYILRLISTKKYVYKQYPFINFHAAPDFNAIEGRWDAFFYELPKLVINYTPMVFISVFINLTWVSIYSVYNMVYSSIFMIISVFTTGINAVFGNLLVRKSALIAEKFDLFVFIFNMANLVLYCSSVVLVLPFLELYINSSVNYLYLSLAIGFTLSGYFRSSRLPYNVIIEASGKFKENKKPNILEAIVFFILSLIMLNFLGVFGILLASAITGFVRNIFYILFVDRKIIDRSVTKSLFLYIYNCLILAMVPIFVNNIIGYKDTSVLQWIIKAILVVCLSTLLIFLLESPFNTKNLKQISKRIKKKFLRI